MNDIREIRLTDSFVMEYWFGELDHDETEIPRFQDVMDWIAANHPADILIADRVYAHVKSLYFTESHI